MVINSKVPEAIHLVAENLLARVNAGPVYQPLCYWFSDLEDSYNEAGITDSWTRCLHLLSFLERELPYTNQLLLDFKLEEQGLPRHNNSYEQVKQCMLDMWT